MKKIEVVLKNGMNVWIVDVPDNEILVVGDDGFLRVPGSELVYLNASEIVMITEKKQREKP